MPADTAIRTLLCNLYSFDELRRSLHDFDQDLYRSIPQEGTSLVEYAYNVIEALSRRGIVEEYLERVAEERPQRLGDILAAHRDEGTARATTSNLRETLDGLRIRFSDLRNSLEPGEGRYQKLDKVFFEMVDLLSGLPERPESLSPWVWDLSGRAPFYAWAFSNPGSVLLPELLTLVSLHETEGYGHYWGMRVLQRLLEDGPRRSIEPKLYHAFMALKAEFRDNGRRCVLFDSVSKGLSLKGEVKEVKDPAVQAKGPPSAPPRAARAPRKTRLSSLD